VATDKYYFFFINNNIPKRENIIPQTKFIEETLRPVGLTTKYKQYSPINKTIIPKALKITLYLLIPSSRF